MNESDDSEAPEVDPAPAPPHGLTLFDHAAVAAEIAETRRSMKETLDARSLTEAQWNESTAFWMHRMLVDVQTHKEKARVAVVYSSAFGDAQDALANVREMTPEQYADLVVDMQRDDGRARAARNLSQADHQRLVRHFAKRLAADADEAQRFADRFAARTTPPA